MKILIAITVLVISCEPLLAGDAWIAAGGGVGSEGLAGYASGSIQVGSQGLISMRWAGTQGSSPVNDDGFFSGPSFSPGARDYGLLFGLVKTGRQPAYSLSVSLGLGLATITERGEWVDNWVFPDYWDKETHETTGFLMQCELFSKSIGCQLFADFNSVKSFGGLVISWRFLHAGKHR